MRTRLDNYLQSIKKIMLIIGIICATSIAIAISIVIIKYIFQYVF